MACRTGRKGSECRCRFGARTGRIDGVAVERCFHWDDVLGLRRKPSSHVQPRHHRRVDETPCRRDGHGISDGPLLVDDAEHVSQRRRQSEVVTEDPCRGQGRIDPGDDSRDAGRSERTLFHPVLAAIVGRSNLNRTDRHSSRPTEQKVIGRRTSWTERLAPKASNALAIVDELRFIHVDANCGTGVLVRALSIAVVLKMG